jgi:hypothetical protein
LNYEIDEKTLVHVVAFGDGVPYQEILDTIAVTEAPLKPTKYAPYFRKIEKAETGNYWLAEAKNIVELSLKK